MKIKTILEQVNGIYYANGKVDGIGWSDSPKLSEQEQKIKNIIRAQIISILRENEGYLYAYATKLADKMLKEV